MSATIRRARPDEAETITDLVLRSKAHWGYADEFMRYVAPILTVTAAYLNQHLAYVLVEGDQVLGFASLKELTPEEVELDLLFVRPEAIGQGVGRQLLAKMKEVAAAAGYQTLFIESDPYAAGFYEQMGGHLIGYRPVPAIPDRQLPLYRIFLDTDDRG